MTNRSDNWQILLATLADDGALRPFVQEGAVLLWSLDGKRLLHANPAGQAVWGRDNNSSVSPALERLRLLGTGLAPRTGVRLERLRLLPHSSAALVTCACRLIAGNGSGDVLMTAVSAQELARIGLQLSRMKNETAPSLPVASPSVEAASVDREAAKSVARPFRFTWESDAEGRVTAVSSAFAELAGSVAAAAMVGRNWKDLLTVDIVDPYGYATAALGAQETFSGCAVIWRLADGQKGRPLQLSAMPVLNEAGFAGFRGFGVIQAGESIEIAPVNTVAVPSTEHPDERSDDSPMPDFPYPVNDESPPKRSPEDAANVPQGKPATEPVMAPPASSQDMARSSDPDLPLAAAEKGGDSPTSGKPSVTGRHLRLVPTHKLTSGTRASPITSPGSDDSSSRPALTSAERNAFREIAQALGARLEAGSQRPPVGVKLPALPEALPPEPVATGTGERSTRADIDPTIANDGTIDEAAAIPGPDNRRVSDPAMVISDAGTMPGPDPDLGKAEDVLRDISQPRVLSSEVETGLRQESAPTAIPLSETVSTDADPAEEARFRPRRGLNLHADVLDRLPIAVAVCGTDEVLYANRTLLDLLDYADVDDLNATGGLSRAISGQIGESPALVTLIDRHSTVIPVDSHASAIVWKDKNATLMSFRRAANEAEIRSKMEALTLDVTARDARLSEMTAVLDTATDGVVTVDERGRLLSMNRSAEALFGYDQREVTGDLFTLLLAPESHTRALDYLEGLKGGGVASVLNDGREVIGRVRQGGRITLFMTMGQIAEAGPSTDGGRRFCAVLRDITAWKKTELELVEARKAAERASAQKSDVLAKISHEIRTPLNAIIGFSEVMAEERFGPIGNERYKEYLRDIHESGGYVISLVNDLLDLAKIEAGKLDLDFVSVNLNEITAGAVALLQPEAQRGRVVLRTGLSPKLPPVVADERSIRQIMINVLSNAVKFTDAGGQVIVSTALGDKGEAIIRVRDTGIGMTESDLKLALEPFRQVPSTRKAGGTGLGLPLTKALVEANRASLAITSARNEGTLIEIIFPPQRVLAS